MLSFTGRQFLRGRALVQGRSIVSIIEKKEILQCQQVNRSFANSSSIVNGTVRASPSSLHVPGSCRFFATDGDSKSADSEEENATTKDESDTATAEGAEEPKTVTKEEQLENEKKELKDQLLRAMAESENTRRIAQRDVASARSFAVSSFAKSLLDTSDNLTRAMDAVPVDKRNDTENQPVLATLYEGIKMTNDGLTKAFEKNGLKKFGAIGEPFDPNLHTALFEYPDPEKERGSIGQIMKAGFKLNDRVIRSAEVGVVKNA